MYKLPKPVNKFFFGGGGGWMLAVSPLLSQCLAYGILNVALLCICVQLWICIIFHLWQCCVYVAVE